MTKLYNKQIKPLKFKEASKYPEMVKEFQKIIGEEAKSQILELENKILGLDSNEIPEVQLENLKERYASVQGYIENNRDKISDEDLKQCENIKKELRSKNLILF